MKVLGSQFLSYCATLVPSSDSTALLKTKLCPHNFVFDYFVIKSLIKQTTPQNTTSIIKSIQYCAQAQRSGTESSKKISTARFLSFQTPGKGDAPEDWNKMLADV